MKVYRVRYMGPYSETPQQRWCSSQDECARVRGTLRKLTGKHDMAFEIEAIDLPRSGRAMKEFLNKYALAYENPITR
jgi:hypothetical protein